MADNYMIITVGEKTLPSPTDVNITDEILWSSSTGRSVKTGEMMGSVIAKKHTMEIEWVNISESQYDAIKSVLIAGFFGPVQYKKASGTAKLRMAKAYRGNFTEKTGFAGGTFLCKSLKVSIIEK